MSLIGKCQACASTASITKISAKPHTLHADHNGGFDDDGEIIPTYAWRSCMIMFSAAVGIRIEDVLKPKPGEFFNKYSCTTLHRVLCSNGLNEMV